MKTNTMFCALLLVAMPAFAQESSPPPVDTAISASKPEEPPSEPAPNLYVAPAKPKPVGPQPVANTNKGACDIDVYMNQSVAKDKTFGVAYMKFSENGVEYQCPVHWKLGKLAHATVYRGVGAGVETVHQGNLAEEGFWGSRSLPLTNLAVGAEITPISVELRWRDGKAVQPLAETKFDIYGGNKLFSPDANHLNLGYTMEAGVLIKLKGKTYLRFAGGDQHWSDAYLTGLRPESNPTTKSPNPPMGHSDPGANAQFAQGGILIYYGGERSQIVSPVEKTGLLHTLDSIGHFFVPHAPVEESSRQ